MGICLESVQRYLSSQTHFLDKRDLIGMVSVILPDLLTVLGHYTTDTECNHQICRAIVLILVLMADRMHDSIYMNKFAPLPYTKRADERALFATLDWTAVNQAQFKVSETTRTQAECMINMYLERMIQDELEYELIHDVENLVLWIAAGMFMSLVPLTRDPCPCFKCHVHHSS